MPATYTYPGVYVEEIPSGVHPIAGVSTSETAFVDFFARGPLNTPTRVTSLEEFERIFGGLHVDSEASYAIQTYFLNGGSAAWIVRVAATGGDAPKAATAFLEGKDTSNGLDVTAATPGAWGGSLPTNASANDKKVPRPGLQVGVDREQVTTGHFNLFVREVAQVGGALQVVANEVYRDLTLAAGSPKNVETVVNLQSQLVSVAKTGAADDALKETASAAPKAITPGDLGTVAADFSADKFTELMAGADGKKGGRTQLTAGIEALDDIAPFIFNLLVLPAAADLRKGDGTLDDAAVKGAYEDAIAYAKKKRAFVLVDVPDTVVNVITWRNDAAKFPAPSENAAVYHPRLIVADALKGGLPRSIGSAGAVAGVYARTDSLRGVWKAPAGTEAGVLGGSLKTNMDDEDNGQHNILGVNVLRTFPIFGNVVWGSRTTKGADAQASEWKYVPVRRMALYIEESLFQGLKWVVFEPNDEPLWSQIRLNVGAFMHSLFRQGAFAGATPRDAYFVKCDKDTTLQADVDRGIVNIVVGFKPLKPAEFVVLRIQQIAGQIQT